MATVGHEGTVAARILSPHCGRSDAVLLNCLLDVDTCVRMSDSGRVLPRSEVSHCMADGRVDSESVARHRMAKGGVGGMVAVKTSCFVIAVMSVLACFAAARASGTKDFKVPPRTSGPAQMYFPQRQPWLITPAPGRPYRLVKEIGLQSFFHTAKPFDLKIYRRDEPIGTPADWYPVEVCIFGPGEPQRAGGCLPLVDGESLPRGLVLPMQQFDSATLEMLPGAPGKPARPSLVVRASYRSGLAAELHGVYVWNDMPRLENDSRNFDDFSLTFQSVVSEAGQQEFVSKGPLAGAFVSVDQISEGDEPDAESPRYYEMNAFWPAPFGYVKVLSMLSAKRYPSNHTGEGLHDPISVLTPEISGALKSVYPKGVVSVMH